MSHFQWDLNPRTQDLKSSVLPVSHLHRTQAGSNTIHCILWVQLRIEQLQIVDTIMDITEKSCLPSLMSQMQLLNQMNKIAYHNLSNLYWAVCEAPTVCTNGGFHEYHTGREFTTMVGYQLENTCRNLCFSQTCLSNICKKTKLE